MVQCSYHFCCHVIFNIWQSVDDTYFRCLTVPVEDGVEQIDLKKIISVYRRITTLHQDAKEKSKNVSNTIIRPIIRVLYYTLDVPLIATNRMTTYLELIYNAVCVKVDEYGCLLKIPGVPKKNNEILETPYSVLMEELIAQASVNADKLQSLSDLIINSRGSPSRAAVVNEKKIVKDRDISAICLDVSRKNVADFRGFNSTNPLSF